MQGGTSPLHLQGPLRVLCKNVCGVDGGCRRGAGVFYVRVLMNVAEPLPLGHWPGEGPEEATKA